jgi:hypothetical protein
LIPPHPGQVVAVRANRSTQFSHTGLSKIIREHRFC